ARVDRDYFQVATAVDSEAAAAEMARRLVSARLAACVQVIGPVSSTFWWKGEVETATEWLCLAKTAARALDPLMEAIRVAHSYEEPEITAVAIVSGSAGYLRWMDQEVDPCP
ncbi:MAG: divalent-cation tolerance protein CutA, partial [Acidimicrobiales bacterium]